MDNFNQKAAISQEEFNYAQDVIKKLSSYYRRGLIVLMVAHKFRRNTEMRKQKPRSSRIFTGDKVDT